MAVKDMEQKIDAQLQKEIALLEKKYQAFERLFQNMTCPLVQGRCQTRTCVFWRGGESPCLVINVLKAVNDFLYDLWEKGLEGA